MAKPKATPTLNYGISVTPSTTNVLPTYIKNWHINTADLVVSDQGTHATELAYIKSLNLHPRIDIEMVIWAGGQITDPLSDYESYLTSLKSAGWPNVASEGGRPGDASYLKSLGLGYVNYNCDQCGLWSAGAHTDPGTVLNLWESYYPSEVQYILQGASSGKPNGVLAGAWSDNGGDNAILTNSLNGGTPSYSSIIAHSSPQATQSPTSRSGAAPMAQATFHPLASIKWSRPSKNHTHRMGIHPSHQHRTHPHLSPQMDQPPHTPSP